MEKTDWACPRRRNSYRLRMLESGGGMSGMAERLQSRGNRNGRPMAGTLRMMSVPSMAGALCNGDGDGLVEESEEPFDDDGFVVPSEGWLAGQVESSAHGFEVAKEGGAGVGGNKEAEANAKEDLFHECGSKGGRVEGDDFRDDGEPSEVAHGGQEVLGAVVCRDGAGLPDVDVDDGEWGRYRPGVDKFAVLAGGRVREDAVGARALPGRDVEAKPVPVEPKADVMEGLEIAEVAGGGRRVEDVEDSASEGCGRDDEEKGPTGAAE
eukprot:scaffold948_cov96-Amphora_coffeaeformis.AAC.1